MEIRILGAHSLESNRTKMVTLLVDGVIALDAGSLTSGLSFPEQMQLKAVLLTHRDLDACTVGRDGLWRRNAPPSQSHGYRGEGQGRSVRLVLMSTPVRNTTGGSVPD